VLKEFEHLYEGNIARFDVRPSEFAEWQDAVKVKNKTAMSKNSS
jgi:hypothetical protein